MFGLVSLFFFVAFLYWSAVGYRMDRCVNLYHVCAFKNLQNRLTHRFPMQNECGFCFSSFASCRFVCLGRIDDILPHHAQITRLPACSPWTRIWTRRGCAMWYLVGCLTLKQHAPLQRYKTSRRDNGGVTLDPIQKKHVWEVRYSDFNRAEFEGDQRRQLLRAPWSKGTSRIQNKIKCLKYFTGKS